MRRYHRALLGLAGLALAGCARQNGPGDAATPGAGRSGAPRVVVIQASAVVLDAAASGLADSTFAVISDAGEWRRLWDQAHSQTRPAPALPAVDFTVDRLVVAGLGTRPSTGFGVRVDSIRVGQEGSTVFVTESMPGRSCMAGMALTAPVQVVRVSGDLGTVRFSRATRSVECG